MSETAVEPTVVLLGMMGSGKTAVGGALASLTGWRYLDNDELVRLTTGRQPEEIDASDGEAALHRAEALALRASLDMPPPPLIVGAAAWVVMHPGSVELLRQQPAVVYLRAQPETLRRRIARGDGRRGDATDLAWLMARSAERDGAYRALASLVIDTDSIGPPAIAMLILAARPATVEGVPPRAAPE